MSVRRRVRAEMVHIEADAMPWARPAARRTAGSQSGFTLAELLVALMLGSVAIGAAVALLLPLQRSLHARPEADETQLRLRAAATALVSALRVAGAGSAAGPDALAAHVPPVLPRRVGTVRPDPVTAVFQDRLTILSAAGSAGDTALSAPSTPAGLLPIGVDPGCPLSGGTCGFATGDRGLVYDETGDFDLFRVVSARPLLLDAGPGALGKPYAPVRSARVTRVEQRTFYLDVSRRQLRAYDGHRSDLPVADDVVRFGVRLFGSAEPPTVATPPVGVSSCLHDASGNPRLPVLPSPGGDLVELTPALLSDGPWCGVGGLQYDADLRRLVQVQVTLRVQATDGRLRGTEPAWFTNPGSASEAEGYVRDLETTVVVSPRNGSAGR